MIVSFHARKNIYKKRAPKILILQMINVGKTVSLKVSEVYFYLNWNSRKKVSQERAEHEPPAVSNSSLKRFINQLKYQMFL